LIGKWPADLSPSQNLAFSDIPNGLGAVSKVPPLGWAQIVAYCAVCEVSGIQYRSDAPGDFGWKVLTSDDPEAKTKKLAAEIANGRLAMMAIIGMFFQDGLTGSAWGDWASYTASPLRAFENELGVQAPVGFWDPLGVAADGDALLFQRRRETEIKHGRISMLATMGYITPELVGKFPGYLSPYYGLKFEDVPNGLAAISKVPFFGWLQIGIWCLYCEASGLNFGYITEGYLDRDAGDLGWKPPLITTSDPELRKKKLSAELANGRLAMMAIIGMFFQDGLTGSAWGDWANYTGSPLRAFESELGVQAPVGFWDPLGLAADGNLEKFKRRREIEIKHGRISMLATMGYITPELTGKWPGTLSPSAGLKFSEIPTGLAAVSKVPAVGWLQVVIYCGVCEASGWNDRGEAPGDFKWKPPLLATDDAELKTKRLNAEIANGRLAMMAIIGMFYQDGLTGSAWGDWANYTDSPLRAFESEFGVQAPLGFWDPVGFTKDGNTASFKRRREVEIKHGRVSMLATMGYITPEVTGKFPGFLSPINNLKFEDVPNGLAALSKVPLGGWAQILAYCFFCELEGFDPKDKEPGNLGWKPPYLYSADPDLRARRLNAEIANGRLAMMAIIGMFFQDGLTGSAWGDWANYSDSPLRAFENELGVQAPVGFFDPLDLCADGNVEAFKRRREVEIKHGRISMLATMGYITPEIIGKLPGDLDPRSPSVMFDDIPNGLGAITKVPVGGWIQILAYCAFCEASGRNSRGDSPGDFGWKPPLLATNDPATKARRLNAELANGRLAMMAIIGMFFQDGLTGSAWGDWANYTASPLRAR